jgi:ribosomal protein S18 acetylase RimI-like enzyme
MQIARLEPTHRVAVRALRLRALREEPNAFLASYDEDVESWTEEFLRAGLTKPLGTAIYGALEGGALVGMVGLNRDSRAKARHRGLIWGLYVAPEARRRGVGRALVDAAIVEARTAGIEHLELRVSTTQAPARALYERLGFRSIGTIPAAMRIDQKDLDEALMVLALGQDHRSR